MSDVESMSGVENNSLSNSKINDVKLGRMISESFPIPAIWGSKTDLKCTLKH